MNVGIEINMRSYDVKRFYNIGSEKSWIVSAVEDDENKGKINVCQLPDNCLTTALQLPDNCLETMYLVNS